MKRMLAVTAIILLLSGAAYAGKMYWSSGLTGGGNNLDGISAPAAGDSSIVISDMSGTSASFYLYYAVTGTTAGESSPDRILPDTNTNGVLWYLVKTFYGISSGTGTGATVGSTITTEYTYSITASAGTSTFASRGDHTHGTPAAADLSPYLTSAAAATTYDSLAHSGYTTTVHGGIMSLATTSNAIASWASSSAYATSATLGAHTNATGTAHGGILTAPTGTGFMIWTGGTSSVVQSGTATGFLGASAGVMGLYSSFSRTITDWRQDIAYNSLSTSGSGTVMFSIPWALSSVLVSSAVNTTGMTVSGLQLFRCGVTSYATCSAMSSAASFSSTTPTVSSMITTTLEAGVKVYLMYSSITGTGSFVSTLTGTATGVQ